MRRTTALLALTIVATPATSLAQDDGTDEAVGLGGRVEVPSAGYAVTLPAHWVYVRPTLDDVELIMDEVASIVPAFAPTIETALGGGLGFSLLAFGDAADGFLGNCNILDRVAEGRPLDVVARSEVSNLVALDEVIVSGPTLMFVQLPFGRVARIDVGIELPEQRVESSSYILVDEAWIHTMSCTDQVRPADAWASIVGTFEPLTPSD